MVDLGRVGELGSSGQRQLLEHEQRNMTIFTTHSVEGSSV